jgi:hypothetical protein
VLDVVIDNTNKNANSTKKNNHNYSKFFSVVLVRKLTLNLLIAVYKNRNKLCTNNKDIIKTGNTNTISAITIVIIIVMIITLNLITIVLVIITDNINSTINFQVPPVTIRNRDDWNKLTYLIKINSVEISEAKNWKHLIRVYTPREQNYRRITSLLATDIRVLHLRPPF